MTKFFSIFASVVCAFAFAGTVFADEMAAPAAPAAAQTVTAKPMMKTSINTGEVVSVNATANQIDVKSSEGKMATNTFDVTDKTNIRKAGKEIKLSDIMSGDKVIIAFKHKDDKRIATAIRVKAPKAAAMPAATMAPAATPAPMTTPTTAK